MSAPTGIVAVDSIWSSVTNTSNSYASSGVDAITAYCNALTAYNSSNTRTLQLLTTLQQSELNLLQAMEAGLRSTSNISLSSDAGFSSGNIPSTNS